MNKKLCFVSCLVSTALICSSIPSAPASALPLMQGDLNGDFIINNTDVALLQDYLLGKNTIKSAYTALADVDGNGQIDSFDLTQLKNDINTHAGKIPSGTWIAIGDKGVRYYNFEKGSVIEENTGKTTTFTCSVKNNDIRFNKAVQSNSSHAVYSWREKDEVINLTWDDGYREALHFYSKEPINYSKLLSGTYISNKGLTYEFCGVNGCYKIKDGRRYDFEYSLKDNSIYMKFGGDGYVRKVGLTYVDSMHLSLKWEDGSVERLTLRKVEVKNGITYINGILIANKTYALPSTYNPGGLTSETQSAFNKMSADAYSSAGLSLRVCSGYRSYSYQSTLYNNYVRDRGQAAADTFSARPGHSEHQTGLAIDINNASGYFDNTPEAKWVEDNCWKYGFILRYPKGKQDITGYKYESWHVRYVGYPLSKEIHDSGLTLEEFLCIDSVYK